MRHPLYTDEKCKRPWGYQHEIQTLLTVVSREGIFLYEKLCEMNHSLFNFVDSR